MAEKMNKVIGQDETGLNKYEIQEEDEGRPLSMKDWAENLRSRMYGKAKKVV